MKALGIVCAAALLAAPSAALAFERVAEKETFLQLIENRELTRLGISLSVSEDGAIRGRAFGQDVTGQWRWSDGFFCRDLYYGSKDLGPNCQTVEVRGDTVRFTSDRGAGMSANLTLD